MRNTASEMIRHRARAISSLPAMKTILFRPVKGSRKAGGLLPFSTDGAGPIDVGFPHFAGCERLSWATLLKHCRLAHHVPQEPDRDAQFPPISGPSDSASPSPPPDHTNPTHSSYDGNHRARQCPVGAPAAAELHLGGSRRIDRTLTSVRLHFEDFSGASVPDDHAGFWHNVKFDATEIRIDLQPVDVNDFVLTGIAEIHLPTARQPGVTPRLIVDLNDRTVAIAAPHDNAIAFCVHPGLFCRGRRFGRCSPSKNAAVAAIVANGRHVGEPALVERPDEPC